MVNIYIYIYSICFCVRRYADAGAIEICPYRVDLSVPSLRGHIVNNTSTSLRYSRKKRRCPIPFAAIAFRTYKPFLHFSADVSTCCL